MAYTTINKPSDYFRIKLYAGNATQNRAITWDESSNMKPDWLWFKNRSATQSHCLFDTLRGATQRLIPSSSNGQNTENTNLDSFDTNGFTVDHEAIINGNSANYVCWGWKAANTSGSSNSDGDVTSTVSVNSTAGISIVKWTNNGNASWIGHGLGTTPHWILIKSLSSSASSITAWVNYHHKINATDPEDYTIYLNNQDARVDNPIFNDTAPTSTKFRFDSADTTDYIAYCFAEKTGYSKFGTYDGNGQNDGPFIYTGFKPAFLIQREVGSSRDWTMIDSKRSTFNVMDDRLVPNDSSAEVTNNNTDFLSNGFKVRGNQTNTNNNGGRYIYMAFAEEPLVGTNDVPATAR